jgi:hypothetical protein
LSRNHIEKLRRLGGVGPSSSTGILEISRNDRIQWNDASVTASRSGFAIEASRFSTKVGHEALAIG